MIACWTRDVEAAAVREFFELFKTPWTSAAEDRCGALNAPALLATSESFPPPGDPALDAPQRRLLVLASSQPLEWDRALGAVLDQRTRTALLRSPGAGWALPLYCGAATFEVPSQARVLLRCQGRAAAFAVKHGQEWRVRLGFNPWAETRFLLSYPGQPPEHASRPALERHIDLMRRLMLWAGIEVAELAPAPAGTPYVACLTHDVDFWGLRRHRLDRTAAGFLYRALRTPVRSLSGRVPWSRAAANLSAALRYPLLQAGLAEDFWKPLESYRRAEGDLRSTFFVVPRRNDTGLAPPQPPEASRAGQAERASRPEPSRAVAYQASDYAEEIRRACRDGWEVGLHGLDAWSQVPPARQEKAAVEQASGADCRGVRMHWLYFEQESYRRLEEAGFDYDSTLGYNSAAGFRAGTAQVFRPLGVESIVELPLTVQDTALFYPDRLGLDEDEAWEVCRERMDTIQATGGAFVLNWHGRSLLPERLWGDFYARLLDRLRQDGCWIASASRAVDWFLERRHSSLRRGRSGGWKVEVPSSAGPAQCLTVRHPRGAAEVLWEQTWDVRRPTPEGPALSEAES